jgi:hypothetical protein
MWISHPSLPPPKKKLAKYRSQVAGTPAWYSSPGLISYQRPAILPRRQSLHVNVDLQQNYITASITSFPIHDTHVAAP